MGDENNTVELVEVPAITSESIEELAIETAKVASGAVAAMIVSRIVPVSDDTNPLVIAAIQLAQAGTGYLAGDKIAGREFAASFAGASLYPLFALILDRITGATERVSVQD